MSTLSIEKSQCVHDRFVESKWPFMAQVCRTIAVGYSIQTWCGRVYVYIYIYISSNDFDSLKILDTN